MDWTTAAILGAPAIGTTLFGSGGSVPVPGSMARPDDPTSLYVDESGKLRDDFKVGGLDNQMLSEGRGLLGNLKNRATMQGPTQQAQYLQQAAGQQAQMQRDQMGRDQASQRATQESNLAMKGGLGSGARERLAAGTANQGMFGRQAINQNLANQNTNILAQDEAQKLGLLQKLPGQYQSFGNEQMRRQMSDTQGGMGLMMDKYGRDMQAFAANQIAVSQAQAANAGNKGLLSGMRL